MTVLFARPAASVPAAFSLALRLSALCVIWLSFRSLIGGGGWRAIRRREAQGQARG